MKSLIICIFVIMVLMMQACALLEPASFDQYLVRYNSSVEKAPALLKSLIGNGRVELNIAMNNGSLFRVGFEINNGLIIKTVNGGIDNPTIQIQTREDVLQSLSEADDPITAFQNAKAARNISITGNNAYSNMMIDAALSSMEVLNFFFGVLLGQGPTNEGVQRGSSSDNMPPQVLALHIAPLRLNANETITISYTVSDTGGSGMKRIELWRKDEQSNWQEIKSQNNLTGKNGPISGSFMDASFVAGKYWYGIHAVDNAGNWNDERNSNTNNEPGCYGPIEVEIKS